MKKLLNEKNLLVHKFKNKTWFMCPVTVIYRNSQFIVFRISATSPTFRATDKNGNFSKLDAKYWNLSKGIWKDNNLTYLVPFDGSLAYGIITNFKNEKIKYYINFQEKINISKKIISTMDLELDFVIDAKNLKYHWKDIEEFYYLKSKHIFDDNIVNSLILNEKVLFSLFNKYRSYIDYFSCLNIVPKTFCGLYKYFPKDVEVN